MLDSMQTIEHQIHSADDLESVVRTMKAMAASNISHYENSVRSLDDYYRTLQLGLIACLRRRKIPAVESTRSDSEPHLIGAIVFGSDQGLVGQFNDRLASFVIDQLGNLDGDKMIWTVGERMRSRVEGGEINQGMHFTLPNSIEAITPLVIEILTEVEKQQELGHIEQVYLFNNKPTSQSAYTPVAQRLLPLDKKWQAKLVNSPWPTNCIPQILNARQKTLLTLISEYLFVSLFRATAQSLASENASRLAAMQRAEKNIDELQLNLHQAYHHLRQRSIDEELFDLVGGFEALSTASPYSSSS